MSDLRKLIGREIKARQEFITGKVLTQPNVMFFSPSSADTMWVVDVDIGDPLRRLENVPVKMNNNSRFYAAVGSSVLLKRNTAGRYDVVGPADRSAGTTVRKTYTIDLPTATASEDLGFSFRLETFIWYATAGPLNASAWADNVTPFPKLTIIDPAGNAIT